MLHIIKVDYANSNMINFLVKNDFADVVGEEGTDCVLHLVTKTKKRFNEIMLAAAMFNPKWRQCIEIVSQTK